MDTVLTKTQALIGGISISPFAVGDGDKERRGNNSYDN